MANMNSRNEKIDLYKNTYSKKSDVENNYNYDTSKEGGDNKYINYQGENIGGNGRNIKNQRRTYYKEEVNSKTVITKNHRDQNITQKKEDIECKPLENKISNGVLILDIKIQSYLNIYKLLNVCNIEKHKSI